MSVQNTAHADLEPPRDDAAENAVIASILVDPDAIDATNSLVSAQDFAQDFARQSFAAALDLAARGETINQVTVAHEMRADGDAIRWLSRIVAELPTPIGVEHYAGIVRRCAMWRALISFGTAAVRRAYQGGAAVDEALGALGQQLDTIANGATSSEPVSMATVLDEWWDRPGIYAVERSTHAVRSGLVAVDELAGGFHPGELTIVAALTGRGKSTFLLNVALNAAFAQNFRIAIFSLEMARREWVVRALARESGIDSRRIFEGQLNEDDDRRLINATAQLHPLPLDIDDHASQTIERLRAAVKAVRHKRGGCDLVIVDYLQLMRSTRASRERREAEVAEISRGLKLLARDFDVPVIAAAQLNRRSEQDNRLPRLSDLRESGAIEQDADKVLFVVRGEDRAEKYRGLATIIVAKNRNGPLGKVSLRIDPATSLCADLDAPEEPQGFAYEQEQEVPSWAR